VSSYHSYDLMYGFCATVCTVAGLYRIRDVARDPRSRVAWVVALQFVFVALAFGFAAPTIYQWLGSTTGVPNLATLLVYLSILICSAHFQAMLLMWSHPPETALPQVRRRFAVYAVLCLALIALFAAGDVDEAEHPIDFDATYATQPWITAYLTVYYAAFGTVMGSAGLLGWRYAKVAGRPWLARGLRYITIGAGLALGYCALKVAAVAGALADWDTADLSTTWAPVSASLGALIIAVGITIPALEPRLEPLTAALYRRRALNELQPLWQALYQASPAIALDPTDAGRRRWPIRDLRHRLYRRVIEIQDGLITLHDYLDPDIAAAAKQHGEAAGLTGRALAAAQEAALITAALTAKRDGHTVQQPTMALTMEHAGDELTATVTWLVDVAQAYSHSPVVQAALDHHAAPTVHRHLGDG
jgi:hypothetical protein